MRVPVLFSRCWGWAPEAWALRQPIPIELRLALQGTAQGLRLQPIPRSVTQEAR